MSETLKRRGRALEEAFFRDQAEEYREHLRIRHEEESAREALMGASGIEDATLISRIAGLGIRAETLAALTLIPLVEVAWADGKMEEKEKQAVLEGAESTGIEKDSPSHGLLRIWLEDRPAPDLTQLWREFIAALCKELSGEERNQLADNVLGRARAVAEAAGGVLGLGSKVSGEEAAVLSELERTFGS
jgi:hypothetical protein